MPSRLEEALVAANFVLLQESPRLLPLCFGTSAALAQSAERLTRNEKVWGSIPQGGSTLRQSSGNVKGCDGAY